MIKPPKFIKHALEVILFLIFLYIIILLNLYKATKKIEWNIFKSPALSGFLILSLIVIAVYIAVQFIREKIKKENIQTKENVGDDNKAA
jgi:hypothetical protein